MRLSQPLRLAAGLALAATLTSCGDIDTRTQTSPSTMTTTTTRSSSDGLTPRSPSASRPRSPGRPHVQGSAANLRLLLQTIAFNNAARSEAARHQGKSGSGSGMTSTTAAVSASLADVMQCIKNHESGDYGEHSHVSDGSGAYQIIPSTWAEWSVRAGYGTRGPKHKPLPTYEYAYEAPAAVQDAVTAYTLTNGGAGNWSPRYGNDPCTVGLGG